MHLVVPNALLVVALILPNAVNAQPAPAHLPTHNIPGGFFTEIPNQDLRFQYAPTIELKAGSHVIRSSWRILKPAPGTSFIPGHEDAKVVAEDKTLFFYCCALVGFDAVVSGEGKAYVQMSVSEGPGAIPYVWVIDVSGPVAVASPMIAACSSPKGSIAAGAYSLRCGPIAAAHTFKDGAFR